MELDEQHQKQMERCIELAFGYGQWMCLGKSIAFVEINKVVLEVSSLIVTSNCLFPSLFANKSRRNES